MTSIDTAEAPLSDGDISMFDGELGQTFDLNFMETEDLIEHELGSSEYFDISDCSQEAVAEETPKIDSLLASNSTTVDISDPDMFFDYGTFDELVEQTFGNSDTFPGTSIVRGENEDLSAQKPVLSSETIGNKAEEAVTADEEPQEIQPSPPGFLSLDEIDIIKPVANTASTDFGSDLSSVLGSDTSTLNTTFDQESNAARFAASSFSSTKSGGHRQPWPVLNAPSFQEYSKYGQSQGFFLSRYPGQPHIYQANPWLPPFSTATRFDPAVGQLHAPHGYYLTQPDGSIYSYQPYPVQTVYSPSTTSSQSPSILSATYKSRDSSVQPQRVPISSMASRPTPLTAAKHLSEDTTFGAPAASSGHHQTQSYTSMATPESFSEYKADTAQAGHELTKSQVESTDVCRVNPRYTRHENYIPLPKAPQPWGCFRYTTAGELDPRQVYTTQEIHSFLFANPLHHGRDPRTSDLQLFIHRCPAASNHRYPSILSHRCRFSDCCLPTINQGQYAVAFDERSASHGNLDPFIVSGYVHLYCLEKFLDFPIICATLNIKPDNRCLPFEKYGVSPMRLATTYEKEILKPSHEESLVEAFITSCRDRTLTDYPSPCLSSSNHPNPHQQSQRAYEGTLCHRLSLHKLRTETRALSRQRRKRELRAGYSGSSLAAHLGDLEMEKDLRRRTRKHGNQNQLVGRTVRKRMFVHTNTGGEEEEGGEGGEEGEGTCGEYGTGCGADGDEAAYEEFVERQLRAAIAATDHVNGKRKRKRGADEESDDDDGGHEPATKLPRLEDVLDP